MGAESGGGGASLLGAHLAAGCAEHKAAQWEHQQMRVGVGAGPRCAGGLDRGLADQGMGAVSGRGCSGWRPSQVCRLGGTEN